MFLAVFVFQSKKRTIVLYYFHNYYYIPVLCVIIISSVFSLSVYVYCYYIDLILNPDGTFWSCDDSEPFFDDQILPADS
jgi:hypothetical protein